MYSRDKSEYNVSTLDVLVNHTNPNVLVDLILRSFATSMSGDPLFRFKNINMNTPPSSSGGDGEGIPFGSFNRQTQNQQSQQTQAQMEAQIYNVALAAQGDKQKGYTSFEPGNGGRDNAEDSESKDSSSTVSNPSLETKSSQSSQWFTNEEFTKLKSLLQADSMSPSPPLSPSLKHAAYSVTQHLPQFPNFSGPSDQEADWICQTK
ncbi:unnamed protein product [Linum trigynum]|uniref:Uncharacterized protein n=1 Tax=Linum trigynum TaxID=586398 RepID=A0AAV2GKB2_9ROSI